MLPLALTHAVGTDLVLIGIFYIALPTLITTLIAFIVAQALGERRESDEWRGDALE